MVRHLTSQRRQVAILLGMAVAAAAPAGAATQCAWDHGGADNNWTNNANWTALAPAAGDNVLLADNAPNASQIINLDASASLSAMYLSMGAIRITATGDRHYTIQRADGSTAQIDVTTGTGGDDRAVWAVAGSKVDVAVNVPIVRNAASTGGGLTFQNDGTGEMRIGGSISATLSAANNQYAFFRGTSPKGIRLSGDNSGLNATVRIYGVGPTELIAASSNALGTVGVQVYSGTAAKLSVAATNVVLPGDIGFALTTDALSLQLNESGSADRVLSVRSLVSKTASTPNTITIGANGGGSTGHLTLRLTGGNANTANVATISGSTVDLANASGTLDFQKIISGAGKVTVNAGASAIAQFSAAQTYTGGTTISSGTLKLDNGGSLANNNILINGGTLAGGTIGAGGTLNFRIANNIANLIDITSGTLNLTNLKLNVTIDETSTPGEYVLANKGVGSGFVTGTQFANVTLPGPMWSVDYDGTVAHPNSIVLIVPEPAGLGALGLVSVLSLRRRR